ncbi:unnamed protein product [Zymoseptoria tritici ST99CH_1A5]|uniref:D-isomer specific 2-hydroxyacid dehydrogenase NAD-binding domain-containing protein n=1 Tax=Zymoseptoria tritici ST99CH_1A5 TaxID=1276529 RepID=A0A1Y6L861_ZYMTR|nr:unnamed protein product [Zymoseptoria tritici ST99CH_1A5]
MLKPRILLLGKIEHAPKAWSFVSSLGQVITPNSTNRADFIRECKSGIFDECLVAFRTFSSVKITGPWDAELIAALPRGLEFCAHNGAGYDQIDVQACSARDPPLRISNVPTAVDDATADTAVFLMLGALRRFNTCMTMLRDGQWGGGQEPPLGHDPEGKVLGVLGMGGIGRNMAKKCAAFGMSTIYHNRNPLSAELSGGAKYVSFDELLAESDVLSLNLPLNKHTRHIISTPEFAKMKRGVVIINTARGAVMEEAALVEALESGQVGSAGLDVFEKEPEVHPGLLKNPNVIMLPHMGTSTVETMRAMEEWAISNVRMVLEQGRLKSPVPEQKSL